MSKRCVGGSDICMCDIVPVQNLVPPRLAFASARLVALRWLVVCLPDGHWILKRIFAVDAYVYICICITGEADNFVGWLSLGEFGVNYLVLFHTWLDL